MTDDRCAIELRRAAMTDIAELWVEACGDWGLLASVLKNEAKRISREANMALSASDEYAFLADLAAEHAKEDA